MSLPPKNTNHMGYMFLGVPGNERASTLLPFRRFKLESESHSRRLSEAFATPPRTQGPAKGSQVGRLSEDSSRQLQSATACDPDTRRIRESGTCAERGAAATRKSKADQLKPSMRSSASRAPSGRLRCPAGTSGSRGLIRIRVRTSSSATTCSDV